MDATRSNFISYENCKPLGDKRFACSTCGKRFALRSYLNRHVEQSCGKNKSSNGSPDREEDRLMRTAREHNTPTPPMIQQNGPDLTLLLANFNE